MAKKIVAFLLMAFGGFMFLGFLATIKESSWDVNAAAFALVVAAPILGGIAILRAQRKAKRLAIEEKLHQERAARERAILQLAEEMKGRLTLTQVLRASEMTANEAEDILHDLVVKRVADVHTAPDGQAVYEFLQFLNDQDLQSRRLESGLLRE